MVSDVNLHPYTEDDADGRYGSACVPPPKPPPLPTPTAAEVERQLERAMSLGTDVKGSPIGANLAIAVPR